MGSLFPLLNVYIHDRGVSLILIGTLGTAGSVAFSLGGVLAGRLSDRLGRRRDLATSMLVASAVVMLGYLVAREFSQFLVLAVLNLALIGGNSVLIDTLVTSTLPEDQRGGGFGWYRISGSIGFALAGFSLGALTSAFGVRAIFVVAALAFLSAALASRWMQEASPAPRPEGGAAPIARLGMFQILAATGLIGFMVAEVVAVIASQMAYPFLNIYLDQRFAATAGQLGLLSTIGVLAEIPAMIGLGRLSDRWGRGLVLTVGFFADTLSWLLVYLAPSLGWMYLARPLAGMSIIRYSVGVALISDRVPYEQRGTLLGLINLTYGAGGLAAPTLGGLIAEASGIQSVFLVAFAVGTAAGLLFLATLRPGQTARPTEV